ncbi:MAG TPA: hypothetical protein VF326_13740 [Anaerolineaceae bacterium]
MKPIITSLTIGDRSGQGSLKLKKLSRPVYGVMVDELRRRL